MEFLSIFKNGNIENNKQNYGTKYCFIDESGNCGLDFSKEGTSTHFVLTAIIVDSNKINELENKLEHIRENHFQKGEMKSSNIGNKENRRIKLLNDLKDIEFHIFALVINKKEIIKTSGLIFKKTFIKFLNNLLYSELFRTFPQLQIVSDQHGSKEFMIEFKHYISRKHQPDLFGSYEFGFANSKSEVLIQLADIICGTIALGFEEKRKSENFKELLNILNNHIINIKEWPNNYDAYIVNGEIESSTKFDTKIITLAWQRSDDFIKNNENSKEPEIQDQVNFLKFLQFKLKYKPDFYITSNEILNNLNITKENKIKIYYLRSKIVGKLRDSGIIIASSPSGYKLPISEKELYDFVNHTSSIINPMLNRLKNCREIIKLATTNKLDILNKEEYKNLRKFFDDK